MRHQFYLSRLGFYFNAALSSEEKDLMEAYLKECTSCRAEIDKKS